MLRNCTKQFKERYQVARPRPSSPRLTRKLEQSASTAARTFQVRTKESVEMGHRRQLTAPQPGREGGESVESLQWRHQLDDSTLERDPH